MDAHVQGCLTWFDSSLILILAELADLAGLADLAELADLAGLANLAELAELADLASRVSRDLESVSKHRGNGASPQHIPSARCRRYILYANSQIQVKA